MKKSKGDYDFCKGCYFSSSHTGCDDCMSYTLQKLEERQEKMIKDCPFCGSEARLVRSFNSDYAKRGIECNGCHITTSCYYKTDKEAIDIWNNRQ